MIDTAKERGRLAKLDGHTPGPWMVDGIAIAGSKQEVCLLGEPLQFAGDIQPMLPNHEGNARLIAAAPDLKRDYLAALDVIDAQAADLERLRYVLGGGGVSHRHGAKRAPADLA